MLDLALAIAHHLAILSLILIVGAELALIRGDLSAAEEGEVEHRGGVEQAVAQEVHEGRGDHRPLRGVLRQDAGLPGWTGRPPGGRGSPEDVHRPSL